MERLTVPQRITSFPIKSQLRDVSFSTYLPSEQPKQVAQLAIDESEISIFEAERYFNDGQDQKESKKISPLINLNRNVDKCDVSTVPRFSSVSPVEGYGRTYRTGSFNATPTASSEASWNSQSGLLSNPPGSMAISMRNPRLDGRKKMNKGSSGKWFFQRKCPCSGKKSVQVEEKYSETKTPSHSHCNSNPYMSPIVKKSFKTEEVRMETETNEKGKDSAKKSLRNEEERTKVMKLLIVDPEREKGLLDDEQEDPCSADYFPSELGHRIVPSGRSFGDGGGFSFPILNPPPPPPNGKLLPGIGQRPSKSNLDDPPRESLEVFQPLDDSLVQRKSMERRGMMSLREDINHRSLNFLTNPNIRKPNDGDDDDDDDDDVMSDASSDLFEIESFSTQSTMYPMYRRRDSLDEMSSLSERRFGRRSLDETTTATPSIAPTECYEPSEASIDWSVTTAEGFSVANFSVSASEYQDIPTEHQKKVVAINGSKRRGNGSLLMSCRCEKAVSVAARPVKYVPDQHPQHHHHQNRSCTGAPQFPVESGRIQAPSSRLSAINIPITRSHSARMSRALTTH